MRDGHGDRGPAAAAVGRRRRGLFVGGWALQLVGHAFEGKKPAFLDDLRGLLDGPLFLVAEVAFALGLSPELRAEVERRAGPTRWGKVEAVEADRARGHGLITPRARTPR